MQIVFSINVDAAIHWLTAVCLPCMVLGHMFIDLKIIKEMHYSITNECFQWEKITATTTLTEMHYCHGNMREQFQKKPLPMARILLNRRSTGLAHEKFQMTSMYQMEQS